MIVTWNWQLLSNYCIPDIELDSESYNDKYDMIVPQIYIWIYSALFCNCFIL